VAQARQELRREGLAHGRDVPLGIALEVAGAAALAELWAEQVGFFALGTNDLMASALGVDRDDPVSAGVIDPMHPGLLRLIPGCVSAARKAARPVTVCGEMAADPDAILALSAFGVDALSVAVSQLEAVREVLARARPAALRAAAPELARVRSADEARRLLR